MIELKPLPFEKSSVENFLSESTFNFHHDKHLVNYVNTTNALIANSPFENLSLVELVKKAEGPLFNNAAQVFNHNFYFDGLSKEKTQCTGKVKDLLEKNFGSVATFFDKFIEAATKNFGSGWTWLVQLQDGSLEIQNTQNANNPLTSNFKPLLTVDVWEHAYYLDYQNRRADYLKDFCQHINWDFVNSNLDKKFQ